MYEALVPRDEKRIRVTLAYLHAYGGPADKDVLTYPIRVKEFNFLRTFAVGKQYLDAQRETLAQFDQLLGRFACDLLVGAPTTDDLLVPYLEVARAKFPDAIDLSSAFRKADGVRGGATRSFGELWPQILFTSTSDISARRAVIIVDDAIADGRTSAVMFERLLEAGLPNDASLIVAAPVCGTSRGGPIPAA